MGLKLMLIIDGWFECSRAEERMEGEWKRDWTRRLVGGRRRWGGTLTVWQQAGSSRRTRGEMPAVGETGAPQQRRARCCLLSVVGAAAGRGLHAPVQSMERCLALSAWRAGAALAGEKDCGSAGNPPDTHCSRNLQGRGHARPFAADARRACPSFTPPGPPSPSQPYPLVSLWPLPPTSPSCGETSCSRPQVAAEARSNHRTFVSPKRPLLRRSIISNPSGALKMPRIYYTARGRTVIKLTPPALEPDTKTRTRTRKSRRQWNAERGK
jgi:hypothetical protein